MIIEILTAIAGAAGGAVGVALRLRAPGDSLLQTLRRVVSPQSGPRPTTPK